MLVLLGWLSFQAATTPSAPMTHEPVPSVFCWADWEGDGDQDVLAVGPGGGLRLLENEGGGRFVDATVEGGLDQVAGVNGALFGDVDQDGRLDLVTWGDSGLFVWQQSEAGFVDQTEAFGLRGVAGVVTAGWVDADGDSRPDLHVRGTEGHRVFANGASGVFEEVDLGLGHEASVGPVLGAPLRDAEVSARAEGGSEVARGEDRRRGQASTGPVAPNTLPPTAGVATAGPSASDILSCVHSITDQAGGACVQVSSVPMLGALYPLGSEFSIDGVTGYVGIGTTSPSRPLEVIGQIVSGTNNTPAGTGSAIGGGSSNDASGAHATIAGGESNLAAGLGSFVGGGGSNLSLSDRSVIAGGVGNRAAYRASVGGGDNNSATGNLSSIAGGKGNEALRSGTTIGGGQDNTADATHATVSGGRFNSAIGDYSVVAGGGDGSAIGGNLASGSGAVVSGGEQNRAVGNSAVVGGGSRNEASGIQSAVGGGVDNLTQGVASAVPGGVQNLAAGDYSLAAGRRARANHDGAFVWGDSTPSNFSSTAPDQFLVRAGGGVGIGTNDPQEALDVDGRVCSSGAAPGLVCLNPNNSGASAKLDWLNDRARIRIGGSGAGATNGLDIQTTGDNSLMRILHNGRVGIGTTSPSALLHVLGPGPGGVSLLAEKPPGGFAADFRGTVRYFDGSDVTPTSGSFLQVGPVSQNLAIDDNEIMARDGSGAAKLNLNADGGEVAVAANGSGVLTVESDLEVRGDDIRHLGATGMTLQSDSDLALDASNGLTVESGTDLVLDAGSDFTVDARLSANFDGHEQRGPGGGYFVLVDGRNHGDRRCLVGSTGSGGHRSLGRVSDRCRRAASGLRRNAEPRRAQSRHQRTHQRDDHLGQHRDHCAVLFGPALEARYRTARGRAREGPRPRGPAVLLERVGAARE